MKIVLAPDKFKGTFTSFEIIDILSRTILNINNNYIVKALPVSDGGDGFMDALVQLKQGKIINTKVLNPVFTTINSRFAMFRNNSAVIEMAQASGISLIPVYLQNPLYTSTYGTGQLIAKALKHKSSKIILGLGGSATNDGGIGIAMALGWKFLNENNKILKPIGANLLKIKHIVQPEITYPPIFAITDVTNTLFGKNGAAYTYAAQKGANANEVALLDEGLQNLAFIIKNQFNTDISTLEGGGSAGGAGAGASFFLNALIKNGSDFFLNQIGFNRNISDADLIITGEGRFDNQSFNGKITGEIIKRCHKINKKVLVISGTYSDEKINNQPYNYSHINLFENQVDQKTAKEHTTKLLEQKLTLFLKKMYLK